MQVPVYSPYDKKDHTKSSRKIESGLGLLDNNAVNLAMALIMSLGGMAVAPYFWSVAL